MTTLREQARLVGQWHDSIGSGPVEVLNAELGELARLAAEDQPKTYPEFLDDMGKLLQAAMPRTDRERNELYEAEAEVRRLRSQLAIAVERQDLARKRYDRERGILMEMFETWKAEVIGLPDSNEATCGETPVRMIEEET